MEVTPAEQINALQCVYRAAAKAEADAAAAKAKALEELAAVGLKVNVDDLLGPTISGPKGASASASGG